MANPQPAEKKQKKTTKSKIQQQIDAAHEAHQKELLRMRISLARQGLTSYQKHKHSESVKNFLTYLKILENWKGAPSGGLHPSHFDKKVDKEELFLINGVYWELVKLHDRTNSDKRLRELIHYMEKYVLFSKNMPHQPLAAETLRKYISNGRCKHASLFKSAYKVLGEGKCYIATALFDVCEPNTIIRLQSWRDQVLLKSKLGKKGVHFYYKISPTLSKKTEGFPQGVRKLMGKSLDVFSKIVFKKTKNQ